MESRKYTVRYERFKYGDNEGFSADVPALPGCITWGRTMDEARAMIADAIECYIEGLRKAGEPVP
jgi:predicted RNase H-like HicB family nuclease